MVGDSAAANQNMDAYFGIPAGSPAAIVVEKSGNFLKSLAFKTLM